MTSKQIKWPDLSTYGVSLKRWMGPVDGATVDQGERYAVIQPVDHEIDGKLKSNLEKLGFEEAWIDGQGIMRRQGSFGSSDLKNIFPKIISTNGFSHHALNADDQGQINKVCNIRGEFGPAPSVVEEPIAEEIGFDDSDFDAAFEGMLGTLADELNGQAETAETADAPEPIAEVKDEGDNDARKATPEEVEPTPVVEVKEVHPEPAQAPEQLETSSEVKAPALVSNDGLQDLDIAFEGFESYLIYQGIPAFVRADFMETLPKLISFLKEREAVNDLAQNAWKEIQNPAEIRHLFKDECAPSDRENAKANIIDPLYPLAFDYAIMQKDPDVREVFNTFAAAHKDDMDAFTDWYVGHAQSCMNEDNKPYKTHLDRGMRSWGSRVAFQMCRAGSSKALDKELREKDFRFIAMCKKGDSIINNTKQGFITHIRNDVARRWAVIEKFEAIMPAMDVETPGMTA